MSPTDSARRNLIERMRIKLFELNDKLNLMLDDDGHEEDCVLRCVFDGPHDHHCAQCEADGE